jgi:hypothetical protein
MAAPPGGATPRTWCPPAGWSTGHKTCRWWCELPPRLAGSGETIATGLDIGILDTDCVLDLHLDPGSEVQEPGHGVDQGQL